MLRAEAHRHKRCVLVRTPVSSAAAPFFCVMATFSTKGHRAARTSCRVIAALLLPSASKGPFFVLSRCAARVSLLRARRRCIFGKVQPPPFVGDCARFGAQLLGGDEGFAGFCFPPQSP